MSEVLAQLKKVGAGGVDASDIVYTAMAVGKGDNTISCQSTISNNGTYLSVGTGTTWQYGSIGTSSISLTGDYTLISSLSNGKGVAQIFKVNSGSVTTKLTVSGVNGYPSCALHTFKLD